MTGIVDFAIKQWRMTISLLIFFVVGGVLAMFTIPLDAEPDVAIPFVTVEVILPGVSPEDAERLLVKPLETELKSLDGLVQIDGIAITSVGRIVLEFAANFDQETALTDVREAVNNARGELPAEAKEPSVEELNMQTLPIIVVNLFGDAPERTLQTLARELRDAFEANSRILEANIQGERDEVLEAVIDPVLMESYGISYTEIARVISQNNRLVTAGKLHTKSGKFAIKVPGLIENAEDLSNIVIRTAPDGSIVKISDISQVRRTYKDRTSHALFNGQASVSLEISKRNGENIIETIKDVHAITDRVSKDWPKSVKIALSQDQTVSILDMIGSLVSSIINAVVLVFIVCIAALGLRSALMVGFAIPASFLMTIFMFKVQGASINMMIMFGMILSVGILVDSAIVIIEYADRKLAEGLDRKAAYSLAGKRMFWPIISSTATTLVAFLPLLFWNTLPGQYMSYFPKTLIYVLTASLLMALVFLPTLGALLGPKKIQNPSASLKALSGAEGDPLKITGFTGFYARLVNKLAYYPTLVLIAILAINFMIFSAFGKADKNVTFFTADSGDEIYVYARARGNTSATTDHELAKIIEERLQGITGVDSMLTISGAGATRGGFNGPRSIPLDTVSRTFLELRPYDQRPATIDIEKEVRKRLENMPGFYTDVEIVAMGPPVGKDVSIELKSTDLETLNIDTTKISRYFEQHPALFEVENTMPLPGIEWHLDIDRAEAGRLGISVSDIGAAVQFVTDGALVGFFRPLDTKEEIDIRVRYPNTSRDLTALDNIRIQTREGALPLSTIVTRSAKPRQDAISRRNQKRVYEIRANVRSGYTINKTVAEVKQWMNDNDINPSTETRFLGQDEENNEAYGFFKAAGISTLFMMAVILLWQFNSFWHVVLTLSAVVLSMAGVLLGLMFYPYISAILCGVGVLALAGIVVNNNIVLIDTFQRLKLEGYTSHDAAVRTAAQRMRPVFLTTVTTIIGLMPMVLAVQADLFTGEFSSKGTSTSAIWAPISYVLVCGLGFSTLLTLILTPVMLAAPENWLKSLKRYGNWIRNQISNHTNFMPVTAKQKPRTET